MYKLRNRIITLILITLITVSCNRLSKKDLSLTIKEYEMMGMPDHTKLWSSQAYSKAFTILSKVKLNNPLSFPRKNSKKSGAVFSCFVNKENLSFVNDSAISLKDRAFEIQSFSNVQNTLIRKYTDDFRPEQYYDRELIDAYIFGLYVQDKMLELALEILNSKDEQLINMKAGFRMVLYGYVQMIYFVLGEQVKSNIYSDTDLDSLSTEVSRSIIKNIEWIMPVDRQKIGVQIRNTIEKAPSGYVKNNYRETLKALNNSY